MKKTKHMIILLIFILSSLAQSAGATTTITGDTFDNDVIAQSEKNAVFVIFTADWCPPCGAFIEKANTTEQAKNEQISLFTIDPDVEQQIVKKYSIKSLPTMLEFKNGTVSNRWQDGTMSLSELSSIFQTAINNVPNNTNSSENTTPQSTTTATSNQGMPKLHIINNTGEKLCYHPMGNSTGGCHDRVETTYNLPIKFTTIYPEGAKLTTRQLMITKGGVWKVTVPSTGWTTYEGMTFCTQKTFNHESGTVDWVIDNATGIEDGCKPLGYKQFGY